MNAKLRWGALVGAALVVGLSPTRAALVGHWTFENGEELVDRTGNFPPLVLQGDATVRKGALNVNGDGTTSVGWAVTDSANGAYAGPAITNKTLMAWVTLESLEDAAKAGSAMTIDRVSGDHFDGIIFAEREFNRWMNGSSGFGRTQDFDPGHEETSAGTMLHLAITYERVGGQLRVTGYRNGQRIGQYDTGNPSSWATGDAEIFFGLRHGSIGGGPGGLDALIHEARLYDAALTEAEVKAAQTAGLTTRIDSDNDGLPDEWEQANFGNLAETGSGDPDGDTLPNSAELVRQTNPKVADTDGDGLPDNVETKTGAFVSATNTGTDPRKADTDGDGLKDGVETKTGVFVSAANTGTDPHNPDTDGDRRLDGAEVTAKTNPNDKTDPPTTLADLRVGHWTFEKGKELVDQAGKFPNLLLKGDAKVTNGKLDLNGSGTTVSGWAVTDGAGKYNGPNITSKTLSSWVILQGLDDKAKAGSAITLDRVSGDHFDGIILAERQKNRWMTGSSNWSRTQDFAQGVEETATGVLTHMAVTYETLAGGRMKITGYRNGQTIGQYETGNASSWNTGDAEVLFGVRHGSVNGGPGALDALIEEASVYGVALTSAQIAAVYLEGPALSAPLLGQWTFEPGEELMDRTGNFPNLALKGNAKVVNGQLDVNGSGTSATGWAVTDSGKSGYRGPQIDNKTLVAWAKLEGLDTKAKAGSLITIDALSQDQFDGIIYAERQPNRWMNGSSFFSRTQDFDPGFEETSPGAALHLAITYQTTDTGEFRVTGYRNGEQIGQYDAATPSTFAADDAEVFFGLRHGNFGGGPGGLDALIEEARLYGGALTAAEIKALFAKGPFVGEDRDGDGLRDDWEQAQFGNLAETPAGDPDGDGSSNADEFRRQTNPKKADTDDDGLKDGAETGAGAFVGVDNTGTDPLKADTDGDGLLDGVENPKLTYDPANGAKQPGTDPNKADTDGDRRTDGEEVAAKTNPTNPLDPPPPPIASFLVGHWTFEAGQELVDRTGNFPPLTLQGDAKVANGQLDVNGDGTTATGWAVTDSDSGAYKGPAISNKTLMAWARLQSLSDVAVAGSLITIDRTSGDHFDGIIFAERQPNRWMNGSSGFGRTQDFNPGFEETSVNQPIHLAITHETLAGGRLRITGYRNGQQIGQYESGNASSWPTGDAEIFFGLRHGSTGGGPGGLDALIEEARLYNEALTAVQISQIFQQGPTTGGAGADTDNDGLPDDWERAAFGNLAQTAANDFDRDGQSNGAELLAKTNPASAADYLRVIAIGRSGADVTILWTAKQGVSYDVERTALTLPLLWTKVASQTAAQDGAATNIDRGAPAGGSLYRVSVKR